MPIAARPVTRKELAEIDDLFQQGVEWLGMVVDVPENLDDGAAVAALVRTLVDERRAGRARAIRAGTEEIAYAIGTVWGDALRSRLGWRWCFLDSDPGALAVEAPDGAYAVHPQHFLYRLLARPDLDNTAALLPHMIAAGELPPSTPGEHVMLG
jgi:hypothetical protein